MKGNDIVDKYDIWFTSLRLSHKLKFKLLDEYKSPYELWESVFKYKNGMEDNLELKDFLKSTFDEEYIQKINERVYENEINSVKYGQENYPKKLTYIDDPPYILFYKGNIEKLNLNRQVAIVGSRKCTNYGKQITETIVRQIVRNNIGIVSGLAYGIDRAAHETALKNGGFTAGILGCGADIVYPKSNLDIYNEMIKKGCIISEFMPGTAPYSYNFPIRNRIISGLSDLVIVAEAGEKSGSLITTNYALEQGRDVMAVPGSVFSDVSRGTNKLIREGASIYTKIEDVFDLLKIDFRIVNKNKVSHYDKIQKRIMKIMDDNPKYIDDIARLANIDIRQLYDVLFELQLNNDILCIDKNYYVKNMNKN